MGYYAWYYNAGDKLYYWTESYNMSTTQFANEVSRLVGKNLDASDISAASRQSDLDAMERRASQTIHLS